MLLASEDPSRRSGSTTNSSSTSDARNVNGSCAAAAAAELRTSCLVIADEEDVESGARSRDGSVAELPRPCANAQNAEDAGSHEWSALGDGDPRSVEAFLKCFQTRDVRGESRDPNTTSGQTNGYSDDKFESSRCETPEIATSAVIAVHGEEVIGDTFCNHGAGAKRGGDGTAITNRVEYVTAGSLKEPSSTSTAAAAASSMFSNLDLLLADGLLPFPPQHLQQNDDGVEPKAATNLECQHEQEGLSRQQRLSVLEMGHSGKLEGSARVEERRDGLVPAGSVSVAAATVVVSGSESSPVAAPGEEAARVKGKFDRMMTSLLEDIFPLIEKPGGEVAAEGNVGDATVATGRSSGVTGVVVSVAWSGVFDHEGREGDVGGGDVGRC